MFARLRLLLPLSLAAAGCVVQSPGTAVGAGAGLTLDEQTGVVALDPAKTAVADASCSAGQVLRRTDAGWECAAPEVALPAQLLAADGCKPGELPVKTADGWACAPNTDAAKTPVVAACGVGQVVRRTESGWVCAQPVDPSRTPVVANCGAGKFVRRTETGWECAAIGGTLQGTFLGELTGDVTGDVTGTLTGNVAGNVTGDVTGRLTGNVTGNVTGDLAGNVKGNVAGNVTGSLTGNVKGDLTGNVKGNVTGSVTGDVTGNVSGTASNITGTLALAHGGTGVTSLAANGLPVVNAAGTAFASLAPGAAGNVLVSDGTSWKSGASNTTALATVTTGALTLYVRTDGSDAACNGSADAAASAAPSCAFASPQAALAAVPHVVRHAVVVNLAAGSYFIPTTTIANAVEQGGSLLLQGTGASAADTVLTGTQNGSKVTGDGLVVFGTVGLELKRLTTTGFGNAAINVYASQVKFTGVSSTDSVHGILCQRTSACTVAALNGETLSFTGNAAAGLNTVQAAMNVTAAVNVGGCDVGVNAESGNVQLAAVTGAGDRLGIYASARSSVVATGVVAITGARGTGVTALDHSWVQLRAGGTVQSSGNDVEAQLNSVILLQADQNEVHLDCATAGARTGLATTSSTLFVFAGSGTKTFYSNGCSSAFAVQNGSRFLYGGALPTFVLPTGAKIVTADSLSLVRRGSLATGDVVCNGSAYCDN